MKLKLFVSTSIAGGLLADTKKTDNPLSRICPFVFYVLLNKIAYTETGSDVGGDFAASFNISLGERSAYDCKHHFGYIF